MRTGNRPTPVRPPRARLVFAAALLPIALGGCKKADTPEASATAASSKAGEAPKSAAGPACELGQLDNALKAVEGAKPEERADMAVHALSQVCRDGAFARLSAAVGDLRRYAPHEVQGAAARAIEANAVLWNAGCVGGTAIFDKLAAAEPEGRLAIIQAGCGLRDAAWLQGEGTDHSPVGLTMAVMYAPALQASKAPAADADRLLRSAVFGR